MKKPGLISTESCGPVEENNTGESDKIKIEFLYFDGCPNHHQALAELRAFLKEKNEESPIEIIKVETQEAAVQNRFVGSPTIRFNGEDILRPPDGQSYALGCRVYPTSKGFTGLPPRELIETAYKRNTAP